MASAMKNVKYTDYEHLTDDAIEKARKRRERERDVSGIELEVSFAWYLEPSIALMLLESVTRTCKTRLIK